MNNDIKEFINEFKFENSDWEKLPDDLLFSQSDGLTNEEMAVLEAIKMACFVENINMYRSKVILVKNAFPNTTNYQVLTSTFSVFIVLFVVISLICTTYYFNIRFNLGLKFITEYFA